MRGLVAECTDLDPVRRIPTISALRERLNDLQATPALSPRAAVADLVQQAQDGVAAGVARIFALARQHTDNEPFYLDELARLPHEELAEFARSAPEEAAEVGTTMLQHLITADWRGRDFDYANIPLGWASPW